MCGRYVETLGMLIYELNSINLSTNLCFTVYNWLNLSLVLAIS